MDGIKRPKRAVASPPQPATPPVPQRTASLSAIVTDMQAADALTPQDTSPEVASPKPKWKKRLLVGGTVFLVIIMLLVGALWLWYQNNIQAANKADTSDQKVQVVKGATLAYIAESLQKRGIIKDQYAFQLQAYLSGQANSIKEGTCIVHKNQSVGQILSVLTKGCNDFKSITFFPGGTIEKPLYKPPSAQFEQTMYVKYVLTKAGYGDTAIQQGLAAQYTGPLFEGKPAGTTLEGYVYGETYYVEPNATVQQVLQTSFDQMYKDVTAEGLVAKYKAKNLNLYQAITLASIVQRELNCEGKPTPDRKERCYQYQRTIAQVFLTRLQQGMSLGSDVTFIYAADMQGVAPTVDIQSPYNTRIHTGLPPGPIASPGLTALKSVGNPTDTDYLFFIAGDDGLIYFARTNAEHDQNIKNHCQKLCNEL